MNYENADVWNPLQLEYFKYGYAAISLSKYPGFSDILKELERIESGGINSAERWDYKAPKYAIFRSPEVYKKFAHWFVSCGLQKEVFDITGMLPILGNISVIRHEEGIKLNTPWHRDTWIETRGGQEKLVGLVHPAIKLYYYPSFGKKTLPRSQFATGTHRWGSRHKSVEFISKVTNKKTVKSSETEGVLFDTSTLHRVCPEKRGERSLRLVFQLYAHPKTLSRFPNDQEVQKISLQGVRDILENS